MSNKTIGKVAGRTSEIRANFESVSLNSIRKVLPDRAILDACQQAQEYSASVDKWRGHRVVLADGTCLTLPNEPELRRDFPPPKGNHGYGRYPLLRTVCLSLAQTMTVINYRIGRYTEDENTLLKPPSCTRLMRLPGCT